MSPVPGKRYDPDFGKLAFDGKVCSRDCEALELAYEEEEDNCDGDGNGGAELC